MHKKERAEPIEIIDSTLPTLLKTGSPGRTSFTTEDPNDPSVTIIDGNQVDSVVIFNSEEDANTKTYMENK